MTAPAIVLRPMPGRLTFARRTIYVRNVAGVEAAIKARTGRQRAAIRGVTERGMLRVLNRAQALCPRDTHYMALHMRAELTQRGYNFFVGWHAEDFIGKTNPVNGRVITSFYPKFVVFGTRRMAGRDPLSPALRAERPNLLRGYARALELRAA